MIALPLIGAIFAEMMFSGDGRGTKHSAVGRLNGREPLQERARQEHKKGRKFLL